MRSSLQDVLSLSDPATQWNFDLLLPSIPGSADTRDLTFKCMTTDLPGTAIEPVEVPLHGVTLQRAGRRIFTHTLNSTFMETVDYATREKFRRWFETMRSWKTNTGTPSSAYRVSGQIVVYNDLPEVVRTCNITGMWPETMAEIPLDGASSALVTLQIGWRYDFWEDE